MSVVNVTALAQAVMQKKINPFYVTGLVYWQFGIEIGCYAPDFVDTATADLMASLLGGEVVQLFPRGNWCYGQVNNIAPGLILPLQNFVAFPKQPGAPTPSSLLVVNGGDLAQACTQAVYFMPQELYTEQAISYLIPNSTMSAAAQAALATSPVNSWPKQPVYWYTPPTV